MVAKTSVEVRLFGAPEIIRAGEPVAVDTRKAIALLAYLVVGGGPASRDRLCTMLWPESNQQRARGALRRTLSSLRSAVGGSAVSADRERVRLLLDDLDVDVTAFSDLIRRGSESALEDAAALYRGNLLAGFSLRDSPEFEEWHRGEAERLRRDADGVLKKLVHAAAAGGDYLEAITWAERRVDLDPLNEPAHRLLILAEAWAGRRSKAIARYRDAVRILDDELGVPPLPETADLYERIRKGEVPQPRVGVVRDIGGPNRRISPSRTDPPFVGRDEELALVLDAYRGAAFEGRFIVVEGEAGIGKTRLAREAAGKVEAMGAAAVSVRCHEGEGDLPYAPLAQLLRDLTTGSDSPSLMVPSRRAVGALVPDLAVPGAQLEHVGEGPEGRIRFYEALREAIRTLCDRDRPVLLVLDDLHLADQATADFVAYLTRRISRLPLALLVTWRRDEIPADGPLAAVAEAAARSGTVLNVSLGLLGDGAVARLVRAVAPAIDPALRDTAVVRSEGVPLFAVEFAVAAATGDPIDDALPEQIRHLLQSRLGRTSEIGAQMLAAAAVLGRAFDPELIRRVSGRTDTEIADALDECEELSLLERTGFGASLRYDFANETLRLAAYEGVPAGRRRLLHRRVSEALSRAARPSPASLGEAAAHAEAAGDTGQAAGLFAAAGDAARSVHANAEADDYYSAALALGHPDTARLHEALGDVATLAGDYRKGIVEYESVAAVSKGEDLARIERKLGRVYARRGDWAAAMSFLEAALKGHDASFRAGVLADLATTAHRAGDIPTAARRAGRALELAEQAGDPSALANATNVAGLVARSSGDSEGALELFDRSRELAASGGDEERAVAALNNLALTHGDLGQSEKALDLLEGAIEKCRTIGDRHREAALLSNLGDVQFALGRREEAAESIKRSAAILAEVGVDGDDLVPEVWMLREW